MDEAPPILINGDDEAEADEPVATPPQSDKERTGSGLLLGLAIALLLGVLVLQVVQLRQTATTNDEIAALSEDVTDLKPLRRDVDILGDQVAALDGQIAAAVDAAGASPAAIPTQSSDGSLPPFQDSANDPAVVGEMTLATVTGVDYYTGAETAWSAEDGKARVWLIWAHWCPYCQAELPELDTWWQDNSDRFPNVELVTVSSAIDDSRSNPLIAYLDAEEFPFPVVVDETGAVSQLFGTSAFPFWVVVEADGTVVLRVAGALGTENVDQIFAQLETMTAQT